MKGRYKVVIETLKETITLEVKRKYTILRGFTGDGKSYIAELLLSWAAKGNSKEIKVYSELDVQVAVSLKSLKGLVRFEDESLIFIDELDFVRIKEFYKDVTKNANQYFIICSRYSFSYFPYSIDEVYRTSYKDSTTGRVVTSFQPLFTRYGSLSFKPSYVVVEDSNSGYEFYKSLFKNSKVISSNGNTNVYKTVDKLLKESKNYLYVIIDGAGGGVCADGLVRLKETAERKGITICILVPESFEYLILRSKVCDWCGISDELDKTYNYCESSRDVSWERYYTRRLGELTKGTKMEYTKSKLEEFYYKDSVKQSIYEVLESGE